MAVNKVFDQAWVTLATNDSYALGALVVAYSLRRVDTNRQIVVLITPGVTQPMRERMSKVFDLVTPVDVLDSNDSANLALLTRPELGITFTKLHCWRLTQYSKCVFLDADTMVVSNSDELFEREELSAAPDVGWPDCFNSGVFVFKPSDETYLSLLQCAVQRGSFDGGDQGLLNIFFSDWAHTDIKKHLPFIYNMNSNVSYSYLPAYQYYGKNVKIVHFIGPIKPWMHSYDLKAGQVQERQGSAHLTEHLKCWWEIFSASLLGDKDSSLEVSQIPICQFGMVEQLSDLSFAEQRMYYDKTLDEKARRMAWERGQVDYLGADAWANIQKKIEETMNQNAPPK